MERIEVEQGFLAAHRYQPSAKLLTVEFRDGRTWTHSEVPPEVYEALKVADFPMLFWAVHERQAMRDGQKLYPLVSNGK